ncbi:helix-turn-helix domain-containing protein [Neisseriaceae bacterium B1]
MSKCPFPADSQNAEILQLLRANPNGVTVYELHLQGYNSPTSRIAELRRHGYHIETIMQKHINKHGKEIQRGIYILKGEPK